MKSLLPLTLLLTSSPAVCGTLPAESEVSGGPDYILTSPPPELRDHRIPTSYESAVMGRRILALTPLGTLSTVFPSSSSSSSTDDENDINNNDDNPSSQEHRPADVSGMPIGLMDYIADCEGDTGNPTILAIKIATSFKNVREGSNISLALQWTPPYPPHDRIGGLGEPSSSSSIWLKTLLSYMPWVTPSPDAAAVTATAAAVRQSRTKYSAANLPRFSLLGYLEEIPDADAESDVANCFVDTHPDAKYWIPGNKIHSSSFMRLVVTHVYWIGGFGDRAYIGWIPVEEWANVTRHEWMDVSLPGEKEDWKEWRVGHDAVALEL